MWPVDEILLSAGPGEIRLALIADRRPVEFVIDRGEGAPGDIVLGRVLTVNRSLAAAFVDIGERLPGFLADTRRLSEGLPVLVQLTAAAHGNKGAALTRAASLAGRFLAYTPGRAGLNVSRRIADEVLRARLKQLLEPCLQPGEGVVLRSAAGVAPPDALQAELITLRAGWRNIEAAASRVGPPARLHAPSALAHLLTDHPSVRRLLVDDRAALAEARRLFPHAEFRADAFALYDTAERFAEALERRVPLRGGGALIIETTAAVTVIDIDSGPGKPMEANLAAMPEIARQIRLRGLAGHIVIDVIPQRDKRAVRQMADDLRLAVAGDPTPTQVVGVTPGGLIELRRDRRRASLAEYMLCDQPPRLSADAIGLKGLRALLREAEQRPGVPLVLSAAPEVIAALRSRPAALDETARRLGRPPSLREDADETFYDLIEEER